MEDYNDSTKDALMIQESVEDWVINKCDSWRNHFEANYAEKFDEYYRLWRGQWAKQDVTRDSERSRIISPALQQAVESSVAELEEATFGRGVWFNIKDDLGDEDNEDVVFLQKKLHEDFQKTKVRKAVAECLINSAVFGVGIAEITLEEIKEMAPATEEIMGGDMRAVGVNVTDRTVVKMRPVMPQNFLIDPVATSVEDAMGVAVDEFVSKHLVTKLQEQGVYRDVEIGSATPDFDIEADQELSTFEEDKVRLTKYYGLVPRALLRAAQEDEYEEGEEVVNLSGEVELEEDSYFVEAIIVIANGGILLKAEENPYMMNDRPIIAFPWDVVPSRFWGRGVCEKGYNSQKALDAEIRARIDALGLTVHPMMAMDATRIPRGSKPEIRPGKILLTNGNPAEILHPFNFGQVSQITFAQASALQTMVQQATGAVDSAGMAGNINGEATAAGISMSLSAIIKRHKRTLINFQESFLIPFVAKAAYRYMQFDPENYPVADYKFVASSSLGIIAREYEVSQLIQLLQTMPATSPLYNTLVESVIESMNITDRDKLIKTLQASAKPDPAAQQAQQEAQEAQMAFQRSQTDALNAQASESSARAQKILVEAQLAPQELEIDKIKAITANLQKGDQDDKEFERRLKIAEQALKEKEYGLKERGAFMAEQAASTPKENPAEQALLNKLTND
jgi:hypothetical protein